ncbi:MAG: hypothetical protein EOO27_00975 [Comamonadaceae bacterium]|nr:MAG: hypothetical protein EOO27_00975 [Comamonadaceae bacterium]
MRTIAVVFALAAAPVWAQAPAILLEACSAMEPASKRLECLRAANGVQAPSSRTAPSPAPQAMYSAPATASAPARAAASSGSGRTAGGQTCYVGPRGGTYTITASGRKNYSGC